MARALKITKNRYINMDTIVEFVAEKDSLNITTNAHPEFAMYNIILEPESEEYEVSVPVNELHRIKRELGKFMGVEFDSTANEDATQQPSVVS